MCPSYFLLISSTQPKPQKWLVWPSVGTLVCVHIRKAERRRVQILRRISGRGSTSSKDDQDPPLPRPCCSHSSGICRWVLKSLVLPFGEIWPGKPQVQRMRARREALLRVFILVLWELLNLLLLLDGGAIRGGGRTNKERPKGIKLTRIKAKMTWR